ncbi:Hypothetical predicted protein [Cloeon dipterum]|uniref:C-type lectin domain-containing protein n=1 Tax=Cloeon dipterum TaxID=197152 RepID=A0A8S1C6J7_9INSE|nr:Hypothetical predicted protein [Cloeon dipterum]
MLRIVIAILGVCLLGPTQHTAAAENNNSSSLFSTRFTHGDGEYEISSVRLPWFKARNLCRSLGKDLVSIESSAENIAILTALSSFSTESFWSAGTRLYTGPNYFYWDSTGLSVESYTNWAPGQPDDSSDYVRIWHEYGHQWDAAPDTYELLFICEWHPCV